MANSLNSLHYQNFLNCKSPQISKSLQLQILPIPIIHNIPSIIPANLKIPTIPKISIIGNSSIPTIFKMPSITAGAGLFWRGGKMLQQVVWILPSHILLFQMVRSRAFGKILTDCYQFCLPGKIIQSPQCIQNPCNWKFSKSSQCSKTPQFKMLQFSKSPQV